MIKGKTDNPPPTHFIHLSNLLTYCSFASAMTAVYFAFAHSVSLTGVFLGIAALSDMLDGRFASLFKRQDIEKAFGAQIDSLSDAISFGLAPLVCLMALAFPTEVGWRFVWFVSAVFYLMSTLTRLAYYNLFSEVKEAPLTGVPTTFAGLIWSTLLLMPAMLPWTPLFLITLGCLMIAPIQIPKPRGRGMLFFIAWGIGLVGIHVFFILS